MVSQIQPAWRLRLVSMKQVRWCLLNGSCSGQTWAFCCGAMLLTGVRTPRPWLFTIGDIGTHSRTYAYHRTQDPRILSLLIASWAETTIEPTGRRDSRIFRAPVLIQLWPRRTRR